MQIQIFIDNNFGKLFLFDYRKDIEDDEEETDDNGKPAKLDFARNPEEIRQEAERRRLSKMPKNSKSNHHPVRDVVGKAKGQGQDKQVLINRSRKNANKNKNHRAMADRKQSKGMF